VAANRLVFSNAADDWLDKEPEGPRRTAIQRWGESLLDGSSPALLLILYPGDDPSVAIEIPGTDLISTCMFMDGLDAIFIEGFAEAPPTP
jgi:hypothetical protein